MYQVENKNELSHLFKNYPQSVLDTPAKVKTIKAQYSFKTLTLEAQKQLKMQVS